MIKQMG